MWEIKVDHLCKNFEQKPLFNDFSLRIEQNTVHALMGPNGAGKTSLLRLITGLYHPDQGTVQLRGKHAMLLENDYLYEDKTGLENLHLFGLYFGFELKGYQAWQTIRDSSGFKA
ncbi:ATP-binding cassette domain-containing protein [Facklamia hominis]|uniref:ATP-binding cassette domain-containing protein n=1 Tax=Facklamia hominis TaxID=178214 RepID=UPI0029D40EED|nr:ATP-binding cassette domain-containing protein [Facklamia hominis]WPJ90572.1 ATP-binding cassette domain-containing protein [Facklamia hominis]